MSLLKKKSKYIWDCLSITTYSVVWDLQERHDKTKHFIPIHFYSKVFWEGGVTWTGSIFRSFEQKWFQWLNLFSIFQFFGWTPCFVNISNYPSFQRKNHFTHTATVWLILLISVWAGPGLVLCFLFISLYTH